jgi:hypothetical protein
VVVDRLKSKLKIWRFFVIKRKLQTMLVLYHSFISSNAVCRDPHSAPLRLSFQSIKLLWSELHTLWYDHSNLMGSHSQEPCFSLQIQLLSIWDLQVSWKSVINHVTNFGNTCYHLKWQMSFSGESQFDS